MSLFIPEAFTVAFKVSLSVALSWLFIKSYLKSMTESRGPSYLIFSILFLALLFIVATFISLDVFYKDLIRRFSAYIFGVLFIIAIFSSGWSQKAGRPISVFSPFIVVLLFGADVISLSFFLKDLSAMKQNYTGPYIAGITGLFSGFILLFFSSGVTKRLSSLITLTGLLFCLATIKLLFGGTGGYTELSLIPAVQRGLMKFFHDFVHQLLVFFMFPDHPLLKTTVWNFIGFFFGEIFTMMATLFILVVPPLIIASKMLRRPERVPLELKGAERRRYIYDLMTLNRKRSVPLWIFLLFVTGLWFLRAEAGPGLYIPQPKPVFEEKGFIILPIKMPGADLGDGYMHKFTFKKDQDTYKFFVFKRPDGRFSVCLDACEICPPEGYGQAKEHLMCIYCVTPIPFNTVGEPGGCNPIPVNFSLSEKEIRIEVQEIIKKWKLVHSGVSEE